jgi:hypothetical protein
MKKLLIATGITMATLTGCAYSQQSGHSLASANVNTLKPQSQYLNEVNVRAVRDFVTRYGDMEDVKWHNSNGSFIAVFFRDSIQHRVMYNKRGDLNYVMKYYEEKQMARNVRAVIKSAYYDYKIYIVQEIETPDRPTVYIVNLQGESDWKKVKLCQGEMEVMEEFRKGK